jgi:hypothetical protein
VTALASLAEFEARLGQGTLSGGDEMKALALLDDASALVRDVAGQPDWTDETAGERAVSITLHVALRAFRNPDGLITQRLGDASWGWHHGTQPGVYLTKQEAESLRRIGETDFRVLTNVTPYNPEDDEVGPWW